MEMLLLVVVAVLALGGKSSSSSTPAPQQSPPTTKPGDNTGQIIADASKAATSLVELFKAFMAKDSKP